ncbi:GtrA family protein [Paraburkholderia madseniana]|uniref:GtrA family protein n=1 Tax=Paraburkholderia madseniana TaxID=2599607 RepID=UPI0038BD5CFB
MISQFLRFGVVGTIGFVVDAAVLYVMLWLSLGYVPGRVVSFLCAAYATWRINRRFTFTPHEQRSQLREWINYLVAMSGGGLVNFLCYHVVMTSFKYQPFLPLLAVAAGSLAGMVVNFATAKLWVFRHPKQNPDLPN